jgi:hypothetical protein
MLRELRRAPQVSDMVVVVEITIIVMNSIIVIVIDPIL